MKKIPLFLMTLMLTIASVAPAHACFYGSASVSYSACYAPQVAFVQAYAYVPAVQYVQYQAPAAYTAVQSYAAPCPPAPAVAEVQAAYTAPVQVTTQETVVLQQYALPRAVSYLTSTYGCSADVALSTLRIIGHHEAVVFRGRADTLVVNERFRDQRRSFFRSNIQVRAPFTDVQIGQRSFFGASGARNRTVTRSVTRTRTRGRG